MILAYMVFLAICIVWGMIEPFAGVLLWFVGTISLSFIASGISTDGKK